MPNLAIYRCRFYSLLAASAMYLCPCLATAQTQQPAPTISAGCGVLKDVVTCNWPAFKKELASARVIAVESSPVDRPTARQLTELAHHLGKTIATQSTPADLTFTIIPAQPTGVSIGPADQKILSLQIFSGASSSGSLLWVENLTGDLSRPWLSNVHAVIEQFEDRLKHS